MDEDLTKKLAALEERVAKLERAGDDLASIAAIAADPTEWEDPGAVRRDVRECVSAWRDIRGGGQ